MRIDWLIYGAAMGSLAMGCAPASSGQNVANSADTASASTGPSSASSPAGGASTTRSRLEGTWEIVHFESSGPLDKRAMPLVGEMFDALRLRFDGRFLAVSAAGVTARTEYEVAEEQGDTFRMVAKGEMFDQALCRFVDDKTWEAVDESGTWPGTSRLQRVDR